LKHSLPKRERAGRTSGEPHKLIKSFFQQLNFKVMAQVIGRLTKDAEIKTTESGKQLVEFSIVENYRYKNKKGEKIDDATFYNCTLWQRIKLAPYLKKGTVISIEGKPAAHAYTNGEGKAKGSLKFTVRKVDFLPSSSTNTTKKAEAETDAGTGDDLPF